MRALIVDDSLTVRMYHKDILKEVGFECDEAENGQEALEKVQFNDYDLMLVDINMPVMDGYTFLKELRKLKNLTPAITVSTESENKDVDYAYESGASFYLIKPVKPKDLKMYAKILKKE